MKKRGLTLIELVVAMSIFITVMTLSVGGFVTISRTRSLVGGMKETQQKVRVANEMIVRYAKQAEYVKISDDGKSLELYFDLDPVATSAKRFEVDDEDDLLYSEKCSTFKVGENTCETWGPKTSLLGGLAGMLYLYERDVFSLSDTVPALLNVKLSVRNNVPGFGSMSTDMKVENGIILGGLK